MKKTIFTIISILFLFSPIIVTAASLGNANNAVIRTCASTSCESYKDNNGYNEVANGQVTIIEKTPSIDSNTDGCKSKEWYKIQYGSNGGYVCTTFVTLIDQSQSDTTLIGKYSVVGYALSKGINVKEGPHSTSNSIYNGSLGSGSRFAVLGIVDSSNANTDACSTKKWYQLDFNNRVRYACTSEFTDYVNANIMDTNNIPYDFETELAKFPISYHNGLRYLHNLYPLWRFYANNTNLNWEDVVNVETNSGLIAKTNSSTDGYNSYLDVTQGSNYNWRNNTWVVRESPNWVNPSKIYMTYLLDPRNSFDEKSIFKFEDTRAYTYQFTNNNIASTTILKNGQMTSFTYGDGEMTYTQAFTDSANFSKVSPLVLIARVRIETGNATSLSVSGNYSDKYGMVNGVNLNGYYNYFNVGSFETGGNGSVANGLLYAKSVGWNDRYKSIVEGSSFLATKYIYNGQETQYYQKFNVNPGSPSYPYGHQYMTNIQAPSLESDKVYWGYKDGNIINQPIVFSIPVYNNMPEKPAVLPNNGNPNNWLTDIKINGVSLPSFDGDTYYSFNSNYDNLEDDVYPTNIYNYTVEHDTQTIKIDATRAYQGGGSIDGVGVISLSPDKEILHKVIVKAENETTKTYLIKIIRKDAPNIDGGIVYPTISSILEGISVKYDNTNMSGLGIGTLHQSFIDAIHKKSTLVEVEIIKNSNNRTFGFATGDIIKLKSGTEEKQFTYVLYGDLNGDGEVSILDLLEVRKIILNVSNLKGANLKAADTDKNGKVEILDLLLVRKQMLGYNITQ